MRYLIAAAVLAGSVTAAPGVAQARGCITGAIIGGIAGHAMHHGIAGAAAGCAAGSGAAHYYKAHKSRDALKRDQQQVMPSPAQ